MDPLQYAVTILSIPVQCAPTRIILVFYNLRNRTANCYIARFLQEKNRFKDFDLVILYLPEGYRPTTQRISLERDLSKNHAIHACFSPSLKMPDNSMVKILFFFLAAYVVTGCLYL